MVYGFCHLCFQVAVWELCYACDYTAHIAEQTLEFLSESVKLAALGVQLSE